MLGSEMVEWIESLAVLLVSWQLEDPIEAAEWCSAVQWFLLGSTTVVWPLLRRKTGCGTQ